MVIFRVCNRHNLVSRRWVEQFKTERGKTTLKTFYHEFVASEDIRTNRTLNFANYSANVRVLSTYQGRDFGTNVSSFGVTKDLDGTSLDSLPDIGAFQYLDGTFLPNGTAMRGLILRGVTIR